MFEIRRKIFGTDLIMVNTRNHILVNYNIVLSNITVGGIVF